MKKNYLLLFTLLVLLAGCSKEESTPATSNTITFSQDSRLKGGWRLDSTVIDTITTFGSPGLSVCTDSILFESYSFTGNTPNPDYRFFQIVNDSAWEYVHYYLWQTVGDSLFVGLGNHYELFTIAERMRFVINGNHLRLEWPPMTLIPSGYHSYIRSYYHR